MLLHASWYTTSFPLCVQRFFRTARQSRVGKTGRQRRARIRALSDHATRQRRSGARGYHSLCAGGIVRRHDGFTSMRGRMRIHGPCGLAPPAPAGQEGVGLGVARNSMGAGAVHRGAKAGGQRRGTPRRWQSRRRDWPHRSPFGPESAWRSRRVGPRRSTPTPACRAEFPRTDAEAPKAE